MSERTPADPAGPGLISVAGDDARAFLRAQLSNDVDRLGPDRHFLAAWCDAKGRTLVVMRVVETPEEFLLVMPAELVAPVLERLRMYVLRAQVTLADAGERFSLTGLVDDGLPAADRSEVRGPHRLLGLPTPDTARALVITPADAEPAPGATPCTDRVWRLRDIDAGLPWVVAATRGLFVPQMLNLHWLAAVDFDKGCYPGQEIIARLHYRGRLTQRLFRLAWRGRQPQTGDDVVDADGGRRGTVVQAAGAQDAGRLLAVIRIDAAHERLATGGATLEMLSLPYPTPD